MNQHARWLLGVAALNAFAAMLPPFDALSVLNIAVGAMSLSLAVITWRRLG